MVEKSIGNIGNYYGGLPVKEEENKFFWAITDHYCEDWEEIPKSLYDELIKFELSKNDK